MSRKYRHSGYQDKDDDRDKDRPSGGNSRPTNTLSFEEKIQRKSMRHAIDRSTHEVMRCNSCGTVVEDYGTIGSASRCTKCDEALHSCRNCSFFSSAARWQCNAEIVAPVTDKLKTNNCNQFKARLTLDHTGRRTRAVSPSRNGSSRTNDPRDAFNNLFKR